MTDRRAGKSPPTFDELDGTGLRIGVLASDFNRAVTEPLLRWCLEGLTRHGVAEADVITEWVPGSFELPVAARVLADSGRVDAIVCLGAVIRGDTAHFDFVAGEAARGIQDVAVSAGVPVMFGVLTTDTVEQAGARARDDETNKGYEAAQGAIHMARVLARLRKD